MDRRTTNRPFPAIVLAASMFLPVRPAAAAGDGALQAGIERDYTYLHELYVELHQNPELHGQEAKTAGRMAAEMRAAGFEVKTGIGGHGVLGILRNGDGPTLLLRTIMDALPIAENTGLPFASTVTATAADGGEVPVSHVCGHDSMMAASIGAVRYLNTHRDLWRGTLLLVAQPADESIDGARTMLADGLLDVMPKPDYIVGYHLLPDFTSEQVAWVPGYVLAGAETAEIIVRGIPGHGSFPADAKDPVPLAAQIVLALQTLITREVPPLETASLNIGSIHGGHEVNAIPAEVKLGLTMRFYSEDVRKTLVSGVPRIAENQARSYGVPEDRLPVVTFLDNGLSATFNDEALTRRIVPGFEWALGTENVIEAPRLLGTDETVAFSTAYSEPVPIVFFFYGSSEPDAHAAAKAGGPALPSLHAPEFAPDTEATLVTGTKSLVGAVVGILAP